MNFMFHLSLCGILVTATVALYIYRHWLENHGDHYIHLHDDAHDSTIISSQATMCKRCETVDKIKRATLVATIVYAAVIAVLATLQAWNRTLL